MCRVALAVLVLLVGPSIAFRPLSMAVLARMRSNPGVGSDYGVRTAHRGTSAASTSSTSLFAAASESAPAPAAVESPYERCERYSELLKGPRWGGPVLGPVLRYLNMGMCCLISPYA